MFKLKKAMAISRLMDRIAEKYSFGFKTEEPRTYVKARGVIKGMVISYIVGAIVTIAIIAWAFLLNSSKMIDEVKNYSPEGYAKCTFGKAFEDFFSDENWRFFKADKNTDVVEFTGKANLNSKEVEVLVQFTLDELGHNPRVHYIEVDGKKAEDYIVDSMFDEIFKDCGDKRSVVKNKKESSDINHPKDKQIKAENNKITKTYYVPLEKYIQNKSFVI